jgi:type II secretory pathway pseudopilin PulG
MNPLCAKNAVGSLGADCKSGRRTLRGRFMPASTSARQGMSLIAILVTLVIVVLATISVASTFVAVRATEQRQRATEDLAQASKVIDHALITAANRKELQGFKMSKTRREFLDPMVDYYVSYIEAHKDDPVPTAEVGRAHFRLAGTYAKLGSLKSVPALNAGHVYLNDMLEAGIDPETFPRVTEYAMGVAEPTEWIRLRGASMKEMQSHGFKLLVAISQSIITFEEILLVHPDAVIPREEIATVLGYSAAMQGSVGRRFPAVGLWSQARDVLESLVRDQPENAEYKSRLADILIALGKLQGAIKKESEAIASYDKAVGILMELAAADPDNETIAANLESSTKELEKLRAAPPRAVVAASPESPEAPAPSPDEAADGQTEPVEATADDQPDADNPPLADADEKEAAPDESANDEAVPEDPAAAEAPVDPPADDAPAPSP